MVHESGTGSLQLETVLRCSARQKHTLRSKARFNPETKQNQNYPKAEADQSDHGTQRDENH
jgi:hypothetical protein